MCGLFVTRVQVGRSEDEDLNSSEEWQQSAGELCVVCSLQEYKWAGQKLKILIVVKNGSKVQVSCVWFVRYKSTSGQVRS